MLEAGIIGLALMAYAVIGSFIYTIIENDDRKDCGRSEHSDCNHGLGAEIAAVFWPAFLSFLVVVGVVYALFVGPIRLGKWAGSLVTK